MALVSMPRAALVLLAAVALGLGALIASARPVAACSCAGFETMRDYATEENAIFTGTAGVQLARGVPVEVDQWLWGDGAAPIVWLSANSFGDGASCGDTPPTPGTSWIWVTWRSENPGDFASGLCSPHQRLDNPEGAAMLQEAVDLFGWVEPPGSPATEPTERPAAGIPGGTDADDGIAPIALVAGGVGLASAALFAALIWFARRSRTAS